MVYTRPRFPCLDRRQPCSRMIQSGTLLIRKGTILPPSILLKSSVTEEDFSAVSGRR